MRAAFRTRLGPGGVRAAARALLLGLALLTACGGPDVTPSPVPATPAPTRPASPAATASPALPTAPPTVPPPPGAPTVTATEPPSGSEGEGLNLTIVPADANVTPASLPDAEAVIIYSLVAHDLVQQSLPTTGTKTIPAYIGINPHAGVGPLLDTDSSTAAIPDDLIDNLADLGTTVSFASLMSVTGPLEDGGQVNNGGIYLTLGVLEAEPGVDRIAVYGSFYRARDNATGYRYTVTRTPGGPWTIRERQVVWDH